MKIWKWIKWIYDFNQNAKLPESTFFGGGGGGLPSSKERKWLCEERVHEEEEEVEEKRKNFCGLFSRPSLPLGVQTF